MCILMVIHKGIPSYPIVVAANRDEYYDRPTQGPHQLAHTPVVWGGRDTRAGGTWLGVNAHGLVIGLTNRRIREEQENDPQRRSRGLLCLEALQCRTATEAADFLASEPAQGIPRRTLDKGDHLRAIRENLTEELQPARGQRFGNPENRR